jgi:phosphatidylglycerol:prolipoprotein diacylglycerol transferase
MLQPNAQLASGRWARLNGALSAAADCTILYRRGDVILVTYGALVTFGALMWMLVTGACLLAHGFPAREVGAFVVGAALSALAVSHALWWGTHMSTLWHEPLRGLRRVGFVSWGGLVGAGAFTVAFASANGRPLVVVSDAVMRGMFAAYAVGRLGCLTYGCCYGRVSKACGVVYRNPASKVVRELGASAEPRHPTQVYSAALGILLFGALNAMPYFGVPAGSITAAACLVYPVGRAWVEVLRERNRYVRSLFTTGQFACAVMFLTGCAFVVSLDRWAGAPAPLPLSAAAIREGLSLAPAMILAASVVFVATSVHRKRIGSW